MSQLKEEQNFKVDFICIGAPRCATTWAYHSLSEHPQICMSKAQETGYFISRNYHRGIKFYASLFSHSLPGQLKGDSTPPYLYQDGVAERIRSHNPDVKLIVCLRNPAERAYSSYLYHRANAGRAVLFTFEEALKEMPEYYIKPSMYYSCLQEYFKRFPKENILILIYEDLAENPREFARRIYSFLGVDDKFVPYTVSQRINVVKDGAIRNEAIIKLVWVAENFLRNRRHNFFVKPFYNFLRAKCFRPWIRLREINLRKRVNLPRQKRVPIKPETQQYLNQIFEPEIKNLEKLMDRDLSFWK